MRDRPVDLVVISGDLTQRAREEQFREARAFVDSLEVPSLAVPGNHDVPLWRFWERLFAPFGAWKRYYGKELEPSWNNDAMTVIGVNTARAFVQKEGAISLGRLKSLARQLETIPAHHLRVVVVHHQLIPPKRFGSQRVLTYADALVDLLVRSEVDLVLAGHKHQTYSAHTEEYYPTGGPSTLVLHTGTTTSSRGRGWEKGKNTCNRIEIGEKSLRVENLMYQQDSQAFEFFARIEVPRQWSRPRG